MPSLAPCLPTPKATAGIAFEAAKGGRTGVTDRAEPEPNPSGQEAPNAETIIARKGLPIQIEVYIRLTLPQG